MIELRFGVAARKIRARMNRRVRGNEERHRGALDAVAWLEDEAGEPSISARLMHDRNRIATT